MIDSVSVEELDWSAESQVLISAEHLWCDFKSRPWAKNLSQNTNDLYIHYMDKSIGIPPSLEKKKALPKLWQQRWKHKGPFTCHARHAAFSFFPKQSVACAPVASAVAKQPWPALSMKTRKFQQRINGFPALKSLAAALLLNLFKNGNPCIGMISFSSILAELSMLLRGKDGADWLVLVTWPAVHLWHSEKLRCLLSRCGVDAPRKTTTSLPLWARIPRVYIWNNELERAKDATCERPLIHAFKNCISISVATALEVPKMTVPICTSTALLLVLIYTIKPTNILK